MTTKKVARENTKKMLDQVERGATFTIKRKGVPVAKVIPWETWEPQQVARGDVNADHDTGQPWPIPL